MSPNVFLECQFTVTSSTPQDLKTMLAPTFQVLDTANQGAVTAIARRVGYGSKICFGSGDAFSRAISNYQLTVNGASLSNARQNLYKQALDRCWFSESTFQRRFSCCGGAQDQYDATPVSGVVCAAAYALGTAVAGFTGDSGISKRIKNYLNAVTSVPAAAEVGRTSTTVTVRWPVSGCGIFSPIGAQANDQVADSCPYKRSAYALAHMNVCSIDILFTDLKECLFRNLSRAVLNGAGGNRADNLAPGGVEVALVDKSARLHLEYMRLPSWRGIPANVNLQCFRIAVHTPSSTTPNNLPTIITELTRTGKGVLENALTCIGSGNTPAADGAATDNACASFHGAEIKMLEAKWNAVVSAQVPSYLCFMLSKSSDLFVLADGEGVRTRDWAYSRVGNPAANTGACSGLYNYLLCRNTDACASIEQFSLEIQSSVGSYVYSDDAYPYVRTRQELFRDHLRYCVDDYLGGDFDKWSRHQCCLLLGADSFIRGLASPGSSFPISINATVRFSSRREYVDGHACASQENRLGVLRDVIQGTPVMLQIYPQGSLALTASSGILSSQNLGHAQSLDILSGRSRRPTGQ